MKGRGTLALISIPKGEKSVRVRTPFSAQRKFPKNHRPQHPRRGLFSYYTMHPSGKRGSPQDLLHPPVEGRGGYKRARALLALISIPKGEKSVRVRTPFSAQRKFPKNHRPQDFVSLPHYGRQLSRKKVQRIPGAESRSRKSQAGRLEKAAGRLPETAGRRTQGPLTGLVSPSGGQA